MDNRRRLYRLIEVYINDFKGYAVQEMYGKGTYIKIHSISFGNASNSVLLEAIVILGDTINEDIIDNSLAEVLIRDSMVYFFPEHHIRTYIRFDS
jgi:transcriptional regulator CtsR